MRRFNFLYPLIASFLLGVGTSLCPAAPSLDIIVSATPPTDEEDPGTGIPTKFFDNYSWRLFVALNWPAAQNERGTPDKNKSVGDLTVTTAGQEAPLPRVWETWKSVDEVFLPGGREPLAWENFESDSICQAAASDHNAKVLAAFTKLDNVLSDLNQVDNVGFPIGPLIARNHTYVRYEIRINRTEFDFIRSKKLYIRDNLPKANAVTGLTLDRGSIDIKAAWREFKLPAEQALLSRYYHREAWAFNPATKQCERRTFGLVGFHIAQKTPNRPQWTWSTFEHVDNLVAGPGAPPGTQSTFDSSGPAIGAITPPTPITASHGPQIDPAPVKLARQHINHSDFSSIPPPETKEANLKWHSDPKIKGTVWENYDLIMTQWPVPANSTNEDFNPFPSSNVANVSMETFVQGNSCISCHLPTTNQTDFLWFLSLRAFPPVNSAPEVNFLSKMLFGAPKPSAAAVRNSANTAKEISGKFQQKASQQNQPSKSP